MISVHLYICFMYSNCPWRVQFTRISVIILIMSSELFSFVKISRFLKMISKYQDFHENAEPTGMYLIDISEICFRKGSPYRLFTCVFPVLLNHIV